MDEIVRKTYVTRMPDKAGAFLVAARIITRAGGNIVRVNYNKAVDLHTLFIEVNADLPRHERIASELRECGYLPEELPDERILMIVLRSKLWISFLSAFLLQMCFFRLYLSIE